jgi:GNAT superfamily N-acetyltransferase
MIKLVRTNSKNDDFIHLVKHLDDYLKITDGDEHDFYNQFNSIDVLSHVIIAYANDKPIGCGALKQYDESSVEIKRMYTIKEARGKGVATKILNELENWTKELGYTTCVLETGIRQVEAVQFYKKNSYQEISNYGQYIGVKNSICFKKIVENEKG